MNGLETLTTVATAVQLIGLVAASALLTFSLLKYRYQVLYPEGVALIAGSLVLLTTAAVTDHLLAGGSGGVAVAGEYLSRVAYTAAAVGIAAATWQFARDFVRFPEETGEIDIKDVDSDEGGFEHAE